jgi:hypothetical protein
VPDRQTKVAVAERHLPRMHTPDRVTGQIAASNPPAVPSFYVFGDASNLRIGNRLGWLTAWGYLSDAGNYGCGRYPQFEGKAGNVSLVAELRAVWNAIQHPIKTGPLIVVTRHAAAAYQLLLWKNGNTELPDGYAGSARRPPMLEKLRRSVATHGGNLTIRAEGAGSPLAEGASSLTDLAGWWSRENRDKATVTQRAADLAEGFLAARGRP